MVDVRRSLAALAFVVTAIACEGWNLRDQPVTLGDPPPDDGIHGFANGCFAVEGFDGKNAPQFLKASTDGFAFSAVSADDASRFLMRPSDLATYLFYDSDEMYLSAQSDALAREETLESDILLLDDSFRSPAEWELQASERDPRRYQLQNYQTGRYLTLGGLTEHASAAAIITLYPQSGCAEFPELTIDADGSVGPTEHADGDVYGIAEIHSHMFSNFAFGGGGTFHGAPFHRLGVEHALPDCEKYHGDGGRRDVVGFFYDTKVALDIDTLLPIVLSGEASEFNHHTAGFPDFTDWPSSWSKSTHQTMYYRWLERAYLAGLRLVVQHATGNSVLCELVTGIGSQTSRFSCNDMVSVDRAVEEARNLERYIDALSGGPGRGWLRIVDSPAQAREVIRDGKLAVVLGIEISNLFNCFLTPRDGFEACTADSVRDELDRYYGLGVRVIFPVHKFDNAFSAGDGSGGIIELGNFINTGHYSSFVLDGCDGPSTAFDSGDITFGGLNKPRDVYDAPPVVDMSGFSASPLDTLLPFVDDIMQGGMSGAFCQKHSMTPLGETLMLELMQRGMLIDVAHLPQHSLARAYELLEDNDYPATKTHGNSNAGQIYRIGGMKGTRLGRCADPNTPGQMGKSLNDDVAEALANGAFPSEALSFDLNGFAGGPRPRFGPDSGCSEPQANPITYPFSSYDGAVTFRKPHLGNREVDFNTEGMLHIGLLPELIEDVRRDGVTDADLEPLFRSAEAYIRMWERAETWAETH
jgi:hypothetical protein